jgi:hypothetical protein
MMQKNLKNKNFLKQKTLRPLQKLLRKRQKIKDTDKISTLYKLNILAMLYLVHIYLVESLGGDHRYKNEWTAEVGLLNI